ncbi:MAG TPA: peptide ABC transporter substrate-binding protein [Spirochaetales bacterium]|nr:peptide ABC transporter substrate-binding protein [Spirochaetales bacterium]
MTMHARLSGAALGAALALALASLVPGPLAAAEPEGRELVAAFNDIDPELDPHHSIYSAEAQVFTAIYEGLFTYNPDSLDPVKAACRSYSRSQDGRTYTFYIREEAAWSDGSPLVARDFRDAWLRAISPSEKADYASFFDVIDGAREYRLGKSADPASVGISIIDDRILQVRLTAKADYFTRLLCHHSFSPIHPAVLASGWRKAFPFPVNGPYKPVSLEKGSFALERNERYWDAENVEIPRLRLVFTDDDADATRRFDNGEIHWLAGPMDLDSLLDRSIQANPMFGTHYWFFAAGKEPWDDPDLRRALALLLPWPEIRSREQYLIPAPTLVLPFAGYQAAKGLDKADAEEAARLLEKSGHAGGKGLPPLVVLTPDNEDSKRVAGLMKQVWEKLAGLEVEVRLVAPARYFDLVRAGPGPSGYDLALTTWIGDFADPLAFLQMWASDSNLNDAGLADPDYDRLLAEASAKEGPARLEALAAAETRLLAGAAVLPIYHSIAVNVVDPDFVRGWYANALDIHPFKYLAFGQRRLRPNVVHAAGPAAPVASLR